MFIKCCQVKQNEEVFSCNLRKSVCVLVRVWLISNFGFSLNVVLFALHSIEFDRDFDYFAIAGVTKKIKVQCTNKFHVCVRLHRSGSTKRMARHMQS